MKTVNELIEKQKQEIAQLKQERDKYKKIVERVRNFARRVV